MEDQAQHRETPTQTAGRRQRSASSFPFSPRSLSLQLLWPLLPTGWIAGLFLPCPATFYTRTFPCSALLCSAGRCSAIRTRESAVLPLALVCASIAGCNTARRASPFPPFPRWPSLHFFLQHTPPPPPPPSSITSFPRPCPPATLFQPTRSAHFHLQLGRRVRRRPPAQPPKDLPRRAPQLRLWSPQRPSLSSASLRQTSSLTLLHHHQQPRSCRTTFADTLAGRCRACNILAAL